MKGIISGLFVVAVLSSSVALACPAGEKQGRVSKLSKKLGLNTEQHAQFAEIMQTRREQAQAHRQTQRAETLNQLSSVLTPEQLSQFESMTERRKPHNK